MSFKSGCGINGEVVMTKIQWVQCLIQGCDVMREVDVMTRKVPMVSCMQWVWFHTYIGCDVISQVGLITQIHWVSCQMQSLCCHSFSG